MPFTVIGVLFARRALAQGDEPNPAAPLGTRATTALKQLGRVDSTLVFGVPLAAYGLQYQMVRDDPWLPALSALAFGIFYVLVIGPSRKKQQEQEKLLKALKAGDRVILASGIYGVIEGVEESVVYVRIADKTKIRVQRSAVAALESTGEGSTT